jgi:hypothetical protein
MPRPRLLKNETVKLVIEMAEYRMTVARYGVILCAILLLVGLIILGLAWLMLWPYAYLLAGGVMSILSLMGVLYFLKEILLHHQWQFIVTDRRIIIISPDPTREWFADAIYLKMGKIQVIDTNWSTNPLWGFFQATTGARDVTLSMTGYEFKPQGAMVKGGLRFPDVMPGDIVRLEELVFG